MSQPNALRVGIVGAGWVAADRHLPAYLRHPDVEIVAIHDRRSERAQRLGARAGVPLATADWRRFLDQDLDLVSVCTPPWDGKT